MFTRVSMLAVVGLASITLTGCGGGGGGGGGGSAASNPPAVSTPTNTPGSIETISPPGSTGTPGSRGSTGPGSTVVIVPPGPPVVVPAGDPVVDLVPDTGLGSGPGYIDAPDTDGLPDGPLVGGGLPDDMITTNLGNNPDPQGGNTPPSLQSAANPEPVSMVLVGLAGGALILGASRRRLRA